RVARTVRAARQVQPTPPNRGGARRGGGVRGRGRARSRCPSQLRRIAVSEKTVLVIDRTWSSIEPEVQVLARVGARIVEAESGDEDELLALVEDADAILTCFAKVSADVIRAGKRLQVVGRYGIGVDNIAVEEATRLGIPVTNVPAYCLDEVAEHALALLFGLARKTCVYNEAVRRGDWALSTGAPMFRIAGRTLGIIG